MGRARSAQHESRRSRDGTAKKGEVLGGGQERQRSLPGRGSGQEHPRGTADGRRQVPARGGQGGFSPRNRGLLRPRGDSRSGRLRVGRKQQVAVRTLGFGTRASTIAGEKKGCTGWHSRRPGGSAPKR